MTLAVDVVAEVQEAVRAGARLRPVAGRTKPALSATADGVTALDVRGLRGIVQYDPAELTLTALAGTPVAELQDALARHGQYLPFDPPWGQDGATLGGTVAAGVSGPGAFRHGGVRDFVLAVRFVDGAGRLVGGGAQVVKNAAGFDLPKLFVGSAGRLGVIVQLSVKVLPAPVASSTSVFEHASLTDALSTLVRLARGPIAIDALDLQPPGQLVVRLGGHPSALAARTARLAALVGDAARATPALTGEDDTRFWRAAGGLAVRPQDGDALVRVPLTAPRVPSLQATLEQHGARARYSLGANVAWVSWPQASDLVALADALHAQQLTGVVLRRPAHPAGPVFLGAGRGGSFGERIRAALDPDSRFAEAP